MTTQTICALCNTPFEAEEEQKHCDRCNGLRGIEYFFGTNAESLLESVDKYPELPIMDSITWRQQDLPDRRYFLYPIIPEASITLIAGEDGSGKSMFCMGITDALAKGQNFQPWENRAGSPIKCFYFEGEMHPYDFQERLIQMDTNENFHVYSAGANQSDANPFSRGNLTELEYRQALAIKIIQEGYKFVVIDNLASLAPGINENQKADYDPINQWLLSLRHAGVTILLVHHLGKGGEQRGTSAREDNVDSIIYIKKPQRHNAQDGCKFDLRFDKFRPRVDTDSRDLVRNRQFWYRQNDQGIYVWHRSESKLEEGIGILKDLLNSNLTLNQIADRHGTSQPSVSRKKSEFIELGYLIERNGSRTLTDSGQQFVAQFE